MKNDQTPNVRKRKKTGSIITGIILIIIIFGIGAWWYLNHVGFVYTDDAYIDANKLNISTQIPGRIIHLYADEGDQVKKGDLLVQLDSSDYIARLHQTQSNMKSALLAIDLAKVRLEQAQINFDRAKVQYRQRIIPKAKFDNLKKTYEAAKVQLKLNRAKIPVIKASMHTIKTTLGHTKVFVPMSGIIAKRWVLAGDVVAPGQAVFTLFEQGNSWVTAMLEETDIDRISIGDTVDINVDAYPDTKFKGRIFEIGSTTASQFSLIPPDNASGNFTKITQRIPVKISIEQIDRGMAKKKELLPGMSVEIKLKADKNEHGKQS